MKVFHCSRLDVSFHFLIVVQVCRKMEVCMRTVMSKATAVPAQTSIFTHQGRKVTDRFSENYYRECQLESDGYLITITF